MPEKQPLTVYYDGSCPICIKDRERYERMAGSDGENVHWFDITGRDDELKEQGIDPTQALMELHVQDGQGKIHRELDAYILLMARVPVLKPLAFILGLPLIRPLLSALYRRWVRKRLAREGRLPERNQS